MKSGNIEEANALANDIDDNEKKIHHHGKRADAIVKGMLQHSRLSTGQKELTDINVLVDEYMRLSYHSFQGMQARDETFNVIMKTDFDETLPEINIIPQDISRVILNIFNNAFYSVHQKSLNRGSSEFSLTVSVVTKKIKNKSGESQVEIHIKDNGKGIPQNVLDKIFQPFFTTKPTGQGTGLGLYLAYDIIKAHNGSIRVFSNYLSADKQDYEQPISGNRLSPPNHEVNVKTLEGEFAEFIITLPVN
jgi:signal transduction histidine kinase